MEHIEHIIDQTFPGADDDIWRNDTSGFIPGIKDEWSGYLKEKSRRYQRQDYTDYYDDIYLPYLELSKQHPEIVDLIQTTCKKWSNGEIDDHKRLYAYLYDIITQYTEKPGACGGDPHSPPF